MTRSASARRELLTIVVGYDFSSLSDLALREATALVGTTPRTELHLVWAIDQYRDWTPPEGEVEPVDQAASIDRMRSAVESALRTRGEDLAVEVFHHVIEGDPAREILGVAEEVGADLVLVGTHGRTGLRRALLGSVAEKVVREAGCPVLVMRPNRHQLPDLAPEPPCPACLDARESSAGARRWCDVHGRPWTPPHRYSYRDGALQPFRPDRPS